MFRQALRVLFPVLMVLSLTLGALAWSASNVAFAASQTGQSAAPTATPVGYANPQLPYYTAPFYGHVVTIDQGGPGKNDKGFVDESYGEGR